MTGRIGIMSRWMVAAFLLCAGCGAPAHAEKRVALVIGNSAYRTAPALRNPAADARLMSDTLLSLGFFVVGGGAELDLDKDGFDRALAQFGQALTGADVALLYYAGHGVETHGLNYLVPVDAHPAAEGDVFAQTISLSDILDRLEKSGTRINLVLLDACRDNPFRDRGVRSATGGLAQMPAPVGTLISFATQPRSVALDGDDGHSPYTRALVEAMQRPGAGLFKTFNEVGLAVEKATHGQQLPWLSSSPDRGQFLFRRQADGAGGQPDSEPARYAGAACARSAARAAGRPAAPRSRHRLRPIGGDAVGYRARTGPARRGGGQDRCRGGHRRLQRRDGALSATDAVRVRGRTGGDGAERLCTGAASLRQGRCRRLRDGDEQYRRHL
jgi:uncharacterized caspase-like protein